MRKLFVLILISIVFVSCEVMELKYYFEVKVINDGDFNHQVGFGLKANDVQIDLELVNTGEESEYFVVPVDYKMYQYVSSSWGYEDNFNFIKGKSYEIYIWYDSVATSDKYLIREN